MRERDRLSRDLNHTHLIVDDLLIVCDRLNDEISSLKSGLENARDDVAGLPTILHRSLLRCLFIDMISFSAASRKLEALQAIAQGAVDQIKLRGVTLEGRLMNLFERTKEIALNGVRHGAALALALAQLYSNHNLRRLEVLNSGALIDLPLTEDFSFAADAVAAFSSAKEIVNKNCIQTLTFHSF